MSTTQARPYISTITTTIGNSLHAPVADKLLGLALDMTFAWMSERDKEIAWTTLVCKLTFIQDVKKSTVRGNYREPCNMSADRFEACFSVESCCVHVAQF